MTPSSGGSVAVRVPTGPPLNQLGVFAMKSTVKIGLINATLAGLLATAACGDDAPESNKGEIDVNTLQLGVTVTLAGNLASASVPLIVPLPNADMEAVEAALNTAVSLVVSNNESGASADFSTGVPVD